MTSTFTPSGRGTLICSHKVENFDTWKAGYDATTSWKPKFGWQQGTVFTADGDRNNVTVVEEFDTVENAKKFASAPELQAAMSGAGVASAPDIRFFVHVGNSKS